MTAAAAAVHQSEGEISLSGAALVVVVVLVGWLGANQQSRRRRQQRLGNHEYKACVTSPAWISSRSAVQFNSALNTIPGNRSWLSEQNLNTVKMKVSFGFILVAVAALISVAWAQTDSSAGDEQNKTTTGKR